MKRTPEKLTKSNELSDDELKKVVGGKECGGNNANEAAKGVTISAGFSDDNEDALK